MRVFALIWAVLQLALPASAALADARVAASASPRSHVEEGPGRNCPPVHSADCVVCKHLSTLSLGSAPLSASVVASGRKPAMPADVGVPPRAAIGAPLARGPPR